MQKVRNTNWRRSARWSALFAVVATMALMNFVPVAGAATSTGGAICDPEVCGTVIEPGDSLRSRPSYEGWVRVEGDQVYNTCTGTCAAWASMSGEYASAWRWTGRTWLRASFRAGQQVYAYPYGSGYHWAWTQGTGWLAIDSSKLHTNINYYPM